MGGEDGARGLTGGGVPQSGSQAGVPQAGPLAYHLVGLRLAKPPRKSPGSLALALEWGEGKGGFQAVLPSLGLWL